MRDDTNTSETPTRREYVKYGGAVVSGGSLAGCAGQPDSGSTPSETETTTPSERTGTDDSTTTETETPEDESYSVTMSPVGTVELDSVPETAVSRGQEVYLLTSLGQGHRMIGTRVDAVRTFLYDQYPGVSFDEEGVTNIESQYPDKEVFYELDPDVIHWDPHVLTERSDNWDENDIEEIEQNVAPFFANAGSRTWSTSSYPVDEGYEFYTLDELTMKFGQVYRVEDRAERLVEKRQELASNVQSDLPTEDEQPSVGTILYYDGTIYAYLTSRDGFGASAFHPFSINDAFSDLDAVYSPEGGSLDMETLIDVDPDVLYLFDAMGYWVDEFDSHREALADDPVGGEFSAVQNDRIYRGPPVFQGTPINLLGIEMVAKQLYPDQFGEWPGIDSDRTLRYPRRNGCSTVEKLRTSSTATSDDQHRTRTDTRVRPRCRRHRWRPGGLFGRRLHRPVRPRHARLRPRTLLDPAVCSPRKLPRIPGGHRRRDAVRVDPRPR
jgi:ABC-type Fe3+-hydroxamate transport system substrate-binding protein